MNKLLPILLVLLSCDNHIHSTSNTLGEPPPDSSPEYMSGWSAGYSQCLMDYSIDSGFDSGFDAGIDVGVDTGTGCGSGSPFKYLPAMVLHQTSVGCVYNPHLNLSYYYRGSGHTHALPDHSGITAAAQQTRLINDFCGPSPCPHFVWMTVHNVVIPDPLIDSITHMYGSEVYADVAASGFDPHMLVFLPDDMLANGTTQWFGNSTYTMQAIADMVDHTYGGLAALAHPMRYSPTTVEVVNMDDSLWGIEGISGRGELSPTTIEENMVVVDARLSAGKYTCISAGSDLHGQTYGYDWGYQLVNSNVSTATQATIWENIRRCNFFAAYTHSKSYQPFTDPTVILDGDNITFSVTSTGSLQPNDIYVYGEGGIELLHVTNTNTVTYTLDGDEGMYVRFYAKRNSGTARILSQPVWVL